MGVAIRNGHALSEAHDEPRVVAPRRQLPGGRAVVGGFLVALAALGAFVAARGTDQGPAHSYVTVSRDLPSGTKLQAGDLRLVPMDLPDGLASRAFAETSALVGRLTIHPLAQGELVQASAVVTGEAADPRSQVSVPVDRSRALDGQLASGERVDVLSTYGTGADGQTIVVVRGAEVLRVDQGQRGALAGGNDLIVLLALPTSNDALAVTHAAQAGKITLVRTTAASTDGGSSSYRPPNAKSG